MNRLNILVLLALGFVYACGGGGAASAEGDLSAGDMQTTENGWKYQLFSTGNPVAQEGDYVYFHSYFSNKDTLVFTSRWQSDKPQLATLDTKPVEGQVNSTMEMMEMLAKMGKGDSVHIIVPIDSLPQVPRGFEGYDEMFFDIKVFDVKSVEEFEAEKVKIIEEVEKQKQATIARAGEVETFAKGIQQNYISGANASEFQTTGTGLKYLIHEKGNGPKIQPQELLKVHYMGLLDGGGEFDNSFKRGFPLTLSVGIGQVIRGWDEGLLLLNKGDKASFYIPFELGYGATGSPPAIPPNANLYFYVEVQE